MNSLIGFLAAHGVMLAVGVTLILAAGAVAVCLARDPERQRRVAELSVAGALFWLVVAVVPLPRVAWPAWTARRTEPARSTAAAGAPRDPIPSAPAPQLLALDAARDAADERAAPLPPDRQETPAAPDAQAPAWPMPAAELLAMGFLAAGLLACLWLLVGAILLLRVLLPARTAPPALTALLHALPGARPTHRLLVSPRARGPFCLGGRHGAVVLPERLRCSPAPALRALLAHEVAHLEAGDPWRQTLCALATPLFCLHPLFWWLRRRAHLAAEVLADDRAAVLVGKDSYARTFIDLAAQGTSRRPRLLAVAPALRSQSEFFRRMTMLLERPQPLPRHASPTRRLAEVAATALLVVTCAGFLGLRPAPAQDQGSVTAQDLAQLRKERDALQQEIEALRADIKKLAASMQAGNQAPTYDDFVKKLEAARAADPNTDQQLTVEEFFKQMRESAERLDRFKQQRGERTAQAQDANQAAAKQAALEKAAAAGQDYMARLGRRDPEVRASSPAQSDAHVLDLLTRAVDLETEMQVQERKLAHAGELHEQGLSSTGEVAECEARMVGAKRKLGLVQAALRAEREATAQEIEILSRDRKEGQKDGAGGTETTVQLIRAKARLRMLQEGGVK